MTSKGKTRRPRLPAAGGHAFKVRPKKGFSEPKGLTSRLWSRGGTLPVEDVAQSLGLSKAQLAETAGLSVETLYRMNRAGSAKTQARFREMLEIIDRVSDWAGGKDQAMAWYRAEPIAEFGGRTAESLVKDGKATAVRDYLDHVALGGFA